MVGPVVSKTSEECVSYLDLTKLDLKFQDTVHIFLAFLPSLLPALVSQVTKRTQCISLNRLRAMMIIVLACVSHSHILKAIVFNAAHVLIIGRISL